ncbi:tumor necrosis factor receptor superfamily member 19 [Anoxybacillus ayderensis]|uniref:Tumor necrosis factor receptor superfamily member 19 n=1 Tax=Anoxybacillus ayderensis TaxID=265546 RepID=A0A0D0HUL1_9BACL|nr:YtzI protein [Anoxybacillus ayderensis]KIP21498.1 tumor necrosis factor receptor superfamily member 19 [Anoxybacillus ayderensis]MED0656202.1 YtzI protein [Anoxybacillus ayderensis]MED0687178.1 YtzI protein [Anoxybacillus ayderensis]
MLLTFIISIIIVFVVLILSVLTISKAYKYKHTIDEPTEKNKGSDM